MTLEERYTLETPEQVEIDFELAGLGSRFCATAIDSALIVLFMIALAIIGGLLGIYWFAVFQDQGTADAPKWILALLIAIAAFLITGGYYMVAEHLMRGQTPGKKAMRIRVIRDDGAPMVFTDVLIRNLLRLIDFLPVYYGVGMIVMFIHPLGKRLGDLAAGTIVVKEGQIDYRAKTDKRYTLATQSDMIANRELRPAHRQIVSSFLLRREELLPEARLKLAEQIARQMHAAYGGDYHDAEDYLKRLLEGRHYGADQPAGNVERAAPRLAATGRERADDQPSRTPPEQAERSAGVDSALPRSDR